MASLGSLVGHGSGADSERQRWSSNLGGVGRGDRRWELREEAHRFLCRTEGKRKKKEGASGGSRREWAEEGGPTCVRSGGPAGRGAPPAEAGGGRAPWSEQGRKWGA
jgi:hypothetical protein